MIDPAKLKGHLTIQRATAVNLRDAFANQARRLAEELDDAKRNQAYAEGQVSGIDAALQGLSDAANDSPPNSP